MVGINRWRDYIFKEDIPVINNGVIEGNYLTMGNSPEPRSGDIVYVAEIPWRLITGWVIQGVHEDFPTDYAPKNDYEVIAVKIDGNWVLYAPMPDTRDGVGFMYDIKSPLGVIERSLPYGSNLPNISPKNGSIATYLYDYKTLISNPIVGDTAFVNAQSYMASSNSNWYVVDSVKPKALMAMNKIWKKISPTILDFMQETGTIVYMIDSDAMPNFDGVNVGDQALYYDATNKPLVKWIWNGSNWIKQPLVQYLDQLAARNIQADTAVIALLSAGIVSSGSFVTSNGRAGFDDTGFWAKDVNGNRTFEVKSESGNVSLTGKLSTGNAGKSRFEISQKTITNPNTGTLVDTGIMEWFASGDNNSSMNLSGFSNGANKMLSIQAGSSPVVSAHMTNVSGGGIKYGAILSGDDITMLANDSASFGTYNGTTEISGKDVNISTNNRLNIYSNNIYIKNQKLPRFFTYTMVLTNMTGKAGNEGGLLLLNNSQLSALLGKNIDGVVRAGLTANCCLIDSDIITGVNCEIKGDGLSLRYRFRINIAGAALRINLLITDVS